MFVSGLTLQDSQSCNCSALTIHNCIVSYLFLQQSGQALSSLCQQSCLYTKSQTASAPDLTLPLCCTDQPDHYPRLPLTLAVSWCAPKTNDEFWSDVCSSVSACGVRFFGVHLVLDKQCCTLHKMCLTACLEFCASPLSIGEVYYSSSKTLRVGRVPRSMARQAQCVTGSKHVHQASRICLSRERDKVGVPRIAAEHCSVHRA